MHSPNVNNVTTLPDTVHTDVVADEKLTSKPEEAVALRDTVSAPNKVVATDANVID